MSYEILYDKQFIKTEKGILPFILTGSNNCYEIIPYGERREKQWYLFKWFHQDRGNWTVPEEVFIENLEKDIQNIISRYIDKGEKIEEIKEEWGYYTSVAVYGGYPINTSLKKYKSFFSNGLKKAMTIEELASLGIYLKVSPYIYYQAEQNKVKEEIESSFPVEEKLVKTEDQLWELERIWKEWESNYPDYKKYVNTDPGFDGCWENIQDKLKRYRKAQRKNREKKKIEQDYFFTLYSPQYGYLTRYTRNGFRYSGFHSSGKRFRTEKEAERYRKNLIKKGSYKAECWQVKKVDSPAVFKVAQR